jgi:hypothetical protein
MAFLPAIAVADTYDNAAELCAGGDTYNGMAACNWMIRTGAWSGADLALAYRLPRFRRSTRAFSGADRI